MIIFFGKRSLNIKIRLKWPKNANIREIKLFAYKSTV